MDLHVLWSLSISGGVEAKAAKKSGNLAVFCDLHGEVATQVGHINGTTFGRWCSLFRKFANIQIGEITFQVISLDF